MAFYYLQESDNRIVASASSLTMSGSADTNFPLSNLTVSQGWRMMKFDAAAASDTITVDLGSALACDFSMISFCNHVNNGITSVQLRRSTDNFVGNDVLVATFNDTQPTDFVKFTSQSRQYWRLTFVGTPTDTLYLGKWILGDVTELSRVHNNSFEVTEEMPQISGSHQGTNINLSEHASRMVKVDFKNLTLAERDIMRAMHVDSKWGEDPITVAVDSDDDIIGLYSRINSKWKWRRKHQLGGEISDHNITFVEDPFPVIVK